MVPLLLNALPRVGRLGRAGGAHTEKPLIRK